MARVLSLRLFVFIEFSHIFNGCEKPRAANAYFFTESIFMLATSSISMHFPQLSQILSGLRSQNSHSPQSMQSRSYNTHFPSLLLPFFIILPHYLLKNVNKRLLYFLVYVKLIVLIICNAEGYIWEKSKINSLP